MMHQSQFIEMFGDPKTNSHQRPTVRFDNVVTLQRGFDLPEKKRNSEGNIPIYGSNGILGYHDKAMAHDGIVTGRSGTMGEVFCITGDYWPLNTTLFSKDTHGNNIEYLCYLMRYFDVSRFCTGTGVPTLNRNEVHAQQIYDIKIDEQNKFIAIAEQADKSKSVCRQAIKRLVS